MAVTDPEKGANGISAFVVHSDDPGFAVGPKERKMGIKGSPTCELYFTDCTIPADRIIGAPGTGFKTALRTLDFTRPTIGAQAVGIAQGALDAAVAYVKERKQFGTSIGSFQGVQFMLADMEMKIEAARHLVYVAAAAGEQGRPDVTRVSASAKAFASDVAMQVTTDAVQLFGGAGLHPGLPGRADDARRQDHPDLRGHQPGAAHGDRTESPEVGRRPAFPQVRAMVDRREVASPASGATIASRATGTGRNLTARSVRRSCVTHRHPLSKRRTTAPSRVARQTRALWAVTSASSPAVRAAAAQLSTSASERRAARRLRRRARDEEGVVLAQSGVHPRDRVLPPATEVQVAEAVGRGASGGAQVGKDVRRVGQVEQGRQERVVVVLVAVAQVGGDVPRGVVPGGVALLHAAGTRRCWR